MKINIYYGGRGLMDDPTLYVINKMQEVLEELNVQVERYNLYELKNGITTLPQTVKDADGIVLASTVEWYGIGGYMYQFLDACWMYGDKEKIAKTYMCPIVMSTTYGEQEGKLNLSSAWENLGGLPCSGLSGYIADMFVLESNESYNTIIEKKTENLYRTIKQKIVSLPASNQEVGKIISTTKNIDLTPQETEQLSHYASDDQYVQQQKEDIQELANMFRGQMSDTIEIEEIDYVQAFTNAFRPQAGIDAEYKLQFEGSNESFLIRINGTHLECGYNLEGAPQVEIQMKESVLNDIIKVKMTFQRAFMEGEMKMKGDFGILRELDQLFLF